MAQPLKGLICGQENCRGRLIQEFDELLLYNELKYLEAMFDLPRYKAKKHIPEKE
jgi:hypothetical protein